MTRGERRHDAATCRSDGNRDHGALSPWMALCAWLHSGRAFRPSSKVAVAGAAEAATVVCDTVAAGSSLPALLWMSQWMRV